MIKCFDIAEVVIDSATKRFAGYHIDKDLLNAFKEVCEYIDEFSEGTETNGCYNHYGYDVDVDTESREIIVGILFDMGEFKGTDPMCTVIKIANDIRISGQREEIDGEEAYLSKMTFKFPGIWVKDE